MSKKLVIAVTGGTTGIGEGIVKTLSDAGHFVVVGTRKNLDFSWGPNVRFVKCDVRNREDHVSLVNAAIAWKGELNCYVNNAGISIWKMVEEVDKGFWDQIMQTNTEGTLWGCQAAAAVMKDGDTIINISSLAGKRGSSNNSVYCASKFAVNGITQALAKELGPRGIRVNAVCPVFVKSPMILETVQQSQAPAQGQNLDTFFETFAKNNSALNRLPTAQDVGQFVAFLASRAANSITGQCMNIDCGVLPQ